MVSKKNPLIHYPRDGRTFMVGQCGNNSLASTLDFEVVTCPDCKKWIEEDLKFRKEQIWNVGKAGY